MLCKKGTRYYFKGSKPLAKVEVLYLEVNLEKLGLTDEFRCQKTKSKDCLVSFEDKMQQAMYARILQSFKRMRKGAPITFRSFRASRKEWLLTFEVERQQQGVETRFYML